MRLCGLEGFEGNGRPKASLVKPAVKRRGHLAPGVLVQASPPLDLNRCVRIAVNLAYPLSCDQWDSSFWQSDTARRTPLAYGLH